MGVKSWICDLNQQLCRGQVRVNKEWLYYRSSCFPPKPGEERAKRRDVALRVRFQLATQDKRIREAVIATVKKWDVDLLWQRWEWPEVNSNPKQQTIGDWVKAFTENYWQRWELSPSREYIYKREYLSRFNWLPLESPLTNDILEKVLANKTKPQSRSRAAVGGVYAALAKFGGLDPSRLLELSKGWSHSMLQPRSIPSHAEVLATYESLTGDLQAGFLLFMQYGIRPHELVYCELVDGESYIRVTGGKTGARNAYALSCEEWANIPAWDGRKPTIKRSRRDHNVRSNKELGAAVIELFDILTTQIKDYAW